MKYLRSEIENQIKNHTFHTYMDTQCFKNLTDALLDIISREIEKSEKECELILKLEKGFYYIGKSENVEKRYIEHLSGYGSSITKKYKPIEIEKVFC